MKKRKKEKNFLNIVFLIICTIFSLIITFISKDGLLGFITLLSCILNGWYASKGKWYNYIFGAVFNICNSIISFNCHLYGIAILSFVLYFPLQIEGLASWFKHRFKNNDVKIRKFKLKDAILIMMICFLGSISFGLLLQKISTQKLAFLDAISNIMQIGGIILLNLRFKESWWVYLINNIADLLIWIINFSNHTNYALIMLSVSISYLLLNIISLIKWQKKKAT